MNRPKRRFGLPVSNVKESSLLLRCGMDRETPKVRRKEKWPARGGLLGTDLIPSGSMTGASAGGCCSRLELS